MLFLLKKNKILFSILMLPYLVILIIGTVRTDNELVVVATITPVVDTVSINTNNTQVGSFNTVPVLVIRRPTILQSIYGERSRNNDLFPISEAQSHLSQSQRNLIGQLNHLDSIRTSIILAYQKAYNEGEDVYLDYAFNGIRVTFPALGTQMRVNDLITEINGVSYTNKTAFMEEFNSLTPGTTLQVESLEALITLKEGDDLVFNTSRNEYVRRFNFIRDWTINSSYSRPTFTLNLTNTQGASGGLMQTLSLLNALKTRDLTQGLTVAGTGTINFDGEVGIIGGVRQKVIAAYRSRADIFFIGPANEREAKEAFAAIGNPRRMSLQIVTSLEEALRYLESRA